MDLTLDGDRVVDMPPGWVFTIDCPFHGKISFDFTRYRDHGREDLAEHMRDGIWNLRHESVGATLKTLETGIRQFWQFLDDLNATSESINRLDQIDRKLLDRYLAWMELQVVINGKNKGQNRSISWKKSLFHSLRSLLVNRQKRTPQSVNPALTFPRNPFPNINDLTPKREPYSLSEQKCIVEALNKDLRTIHQGDGECLCDLQVLAVHLLLLGLATGRNPQSLLELRRDSLQEHPLPDRELLVTTKRRGWSTHATSLRKATTDQRAKQTLRTIPASVGEHFRFLRDFTAPLDDDVVAGDRELVFLWRVPRLARKGQLVRLDGADARRAVRAFAVRHRLMDDRGRPLELNVARLRPTFATELYRRTHDIRRVQQALGHVSAETTARHYANQPLQADRDHAIAAENMVSQFTRTMINGKVLLAADGKLPLQNVTHLLAGDYNTGIARCRNPFREDESVCKKFFACFTCPSMCVFEDDLWRLFSFYYRLLSERAKIDPAQWRQSYALIVHRIDNDIASQFPAATVEAARLKAQQDPHPTWKDPLR